MLPGTGREGRSNRTEAKPGTRETLAEPSGSVLGERALAGSGVRLSWAEGSRRGRWGLFAPENRTGGADSRLRMKPLECITGGAWGRLQAPAGTPSWSAGDPMKAGLGGSQSSLPPYRLMWGQGVQIRIPQALPSGMQLAWLGCSGCLLPQSPLLTQPFSRLVCPTEPRAHVLPTLCSQDHRVITRSKVRPAHVELSGGQRPSWEGQGGGQVGRTGGSRGWLARAVGQSGSLAAAPFFMCCALHTVRMA